MDEQIIQFLMEKLILRDEPRGTHVKGDRDEDAHQENCIEEEKE